MEDLNLSPADVEKLSESLVRVLSELDSMEDIKLLWELEEDLDQVYGLLRSVHYRIRDLID